MKAKQEFITDQEYIDYLMTYYAGLAMQSISGIESQNIHVTSQENAMKTAQMSIVFAEELIKALSRTELNIKKL